MQYVYICRIKLLGMPFVVLDEQLAKDWVAKDPQWHIYDAVLVRTSVAYL